MVISVAVCGLLWWACKIGRGSCGGVCEPSPVCTGTSVLLNLLVCSK